MKYASSMVKGLRVSNFYFLRFIMAIAIVFVSIFTYATVNNDGISKNNRDSTKTDKSGFKSLFSASYFDPSKPYIYQLNPNAIPFVQTYLQTEGRYLEKMKIWGKPYFDMYDGILTQYGLPNELKYLSVIESSLIPNIVSYAGAVGPWQIMPDEARRVGLTINSRLDERTNFFKSTHAAAKILRGLYSQFNDWLLVIAAYNCGAGRVKQAIRLSGSRNFWDLQGFIPLETKNHVKRFIATHYLFEGNGSLTTMTASETSYFNKNKAAESITGERTNDGMDFLEISGKYKAAIIAKYIELDNATFNKLNPNFDKIIASGKTYKMKLPVGKTALFAEKKNLILYDCVQALLNS